MILFDKLEIYYLLMYLTDLYDCPFSSVLMAKFISSVFQAVLICFVK